MTERNWFRLRNLVFGKQEPFRLEDSTPSLGTFLMSVASIREGLR